MKTLKLKVNFEDEGKRLDSYITSQLDDMTRNAVQKLIDSDNVLILNKPAAKNYKIKNNDEIIINLPEPKSLDVLPQDIELCIIYEDNDMLVVNKPKGMVVHPAAGNYDGTLVNALLYHCKGSLSGINGVIRPGIVHRIDKDTSGLLMVAKNDYAHQKLAEQIKEHSFLREYEAVVYGNLKTDSEVIDAPIGRHPVNRKKMAVTDKNSKNAVTRYQVIKRYQGFTHIKCILETGRTHQIRVHMAYIGHPIAGDPIYGPAKVIKSLNGQCLHARKIGFNHPRTGEYLEFTSPLPNPFDIKSGIRESAIMSP